MQNHLTTTLQQLYEANLRSLQYLSHDRAVTKRILNTNDYVINTFSTKYSSSTTTTTTTTATTNVCSASTGPDSGFNVL